MFLSAIEYMIPKPVPFLRVGIANLPILVSVDLLPVPLLLLVVVLKVLSQGIIGGTLFSYVFLFSAAGSFASALAMLGTRRLFGAHITLVGVGVIGALFGNVAQIVLARLLIFGESAWLIAPPFIGLGSITAVLLGIFAERFAERSQWLAGYSAVGVTTERSPCTVLPGIQASPTDLFICGALLFPPFLLQQDVAVRAVLILAYMLLNALAGRRVRLLQVGVVAAGIVVFNLVIPTGRVLAAPVGLLLTEGALKNGLMKATAMTGLVVLSQFSIRPSLRLPGRFGGLVGRSLFYFEAIMNQRGAIDRKDIIGSIDFLLVSLSRISSPSSGSPLTATPFRKVGSGRAVLAVLVAVSWGLFMVTRVHPHPFCGG